MIDVAIIGTGVSGAAIARELSKYQDLQVICLEKDTDVANATTKANSGIMHAGYDPKPGTRMANYNVLGNALTWKLCKELDIPAKQCGSMVLAFTEEELQTIQQLYERGLQNGVPEMELLDAQQVLEREPNVSDQIKGALFAKTAGVVSSWELAIAQIDVAVQNGVKVHLETEVLDIQQEADYFIITVATGGATQTIQARYVVNAAGVYAGKINNMVSKPLFRESPNRGQYYLLDKNQGTLVNSVLFQCPTKVGKGVLVSPTAHGNLIVGPDSIDVDDPEQVGTTAKQLAFVRKAAEKTCPHVNYRETIRTFAGVRAQSDLDEFIVGPIPESNRFFNVANIKSPGLTSAPAIALDIVAMLGEAGLPLIEKTDYCKTRSVLRIRDCTRAEQQQAIKENPQYAHVVCRCETVTEGEIVQAIHSPLPARTVEAVKRRCNAGMGRCQGGFCSPKVVNLICREANIKPEEVLQDKAGSYILTGTTPKGGQ